MCLRFSIAAWLPTTPPSCNRLTIAPHFYAVLVSLSQSLGGIELVFRWSGGMSYRAAGLIVSLFVFNAPANAWESQEVGVTSPCDNEVRSDVTVCHPSKPITQYSANVVSRNCTGDIRGQRIVNGCVVFDLYARGCGEDKLNLGLGTITNCKGRGWISLRVHVPD
jgi:hypothetical protein